MKKFENIRQKYDQFSEGHPYVASMGEAALLYGLKQAMIKGGDRVGLSLGNGRKNDPTLNALADNYPVASAGVRAVAVPVSEELLYRELPDRILKTKGYEDDSRVSRGVKLGIVALFGASPQHVGKAGIPLPQLIGGLNYSRIHRDRGLKASTAAHITNNALSVAHSVIKKKRNKS